MVKNAPERQEYEYALNALKPVLYDLPPKIIAIDGRVGVGKTTLARFLAWRFNISLIETDLFLRRNQGEFVYREEHIEMVVEHRMAQERPVIIEGVVVLRLLTNIGCTTDYHIHVVCDQAEGSPATESSWKNYSAEFSPKKSAQLVLRLSVID